MTNPKSSQIERNKSSQSSFDNHALAVFREQAKNNPVYNSYLKSLGIKIIDINSIDQIPFLPIEFFKSHVIKTNEWKEEIVFESSGTTGMTLSKHFLPNVEKYHQNAKNIFEKSFGKLEEKIIIGLLPSYLERENSSLISMVDYFIKQSASDRSGFYLNEYDKLIEVLTSSIAGKEIILFGVTFALLDLAEYYQGDLSHITIIETGGMKGRREEIVKEELYAILESRLKLNNIYSEYGMTELLSQAYGKKGRMEATDVMKVLIRDINDPFSYVPRGFSGGINVIDLANQDSCSFIETKDLGKINQDGSFEILGRFDNSDIRGCNLMVS